jgi:hypothetical protein
MAMIRRSSRQLETHNSQHKTNTDGMRCKKILIGFGSNIYSELEVDFTIRYLAQPKMLLVGAVLSDLQGLTGHEPCEDQECKGTPQACEHRKVSKDRQRLHAYLHERCEALGCRAVVHQDGGTTLEALMHETRYADLLVISQETYLASTPSGGQLLPVSRVLEKCDCPVLVVPPQPAALEQVVLTFDGSARAMGGIKQFAYVLAGITQKLPVTVLATYTDSNELTASEEKLFIEYLKQHFRNVALHRICENSERTLLSAVGLNENSLVVVNNPSPQNLPLLKKLLDGAATLHTPLRVYTHGSPDHKPEAVNA